MVYLIYIQDVGYVRISEKMFEALKQPGTILNCQKSASGPLAGKYLVVEGSPVVVIGDQDFKMADGVVESHGLVAVVKVKDQGRGR